MKGLCEEPCYVIELLEDGVTIDDVIDGYISEHALVSFTLREENLKKLVGFVLTGKGLLQGCI
jgi:hypothetical protein